jgi:DNA invertase Pin-like site-specific DNA recombinase
MSSKQFKNWNGEASGSAHWRSASIPAVQGAKSFFQFLRRLASVERSLIQERTKAGLAAARQRGRVGGRPKLLTAGKMEAAMKLLASGTPPREVANILGVSIPTLYRHCPVSRIHTSGC